MWNMSKLNDVTELELNCKITECNIEKAINTLKNLKFPDYRDLDILNVCLEKIETGGFDDKKIKRLAYRSSNDWIDVADYLGDGEIDELIDNSVSEYLLYFM